MYLSQKYHKGLYSPIYIFIFVYKFHNIKLYDTSFGKNSQNS